MLNDNSGLIVTDVVFKNVVGVPIKVADSGTSVYATFTLKNENPDGNSFIVDAFVNDEPVFSDTVYIEYGKSLRLNTIKWVAEDFVMNLSLNIKSAERYDDNYDITKLYVLNCYNNTSPMVLDLKIVDDVDVNEVNTYKSGDDGSDFTYVESVLKNSDGKGVPNIGIVLKNGENIVSRNVTDANGVAGFYIKVKPGNPKSMYDIHTEIDSNYLSDKSNILKSEIVNLVPDDYEHDSNKKFLMSGFVSPSKLYLNEPMVVSVKVVNTETGKGVSVPVNIYRSDTKEMVINGITDNEGSLLMVKNVTSSDHGSYDLIAIVRNSTYGNGTYNEQTKTIGSLVVLS